MNPGDVFICYSMLYDVDAGHSTFLEDCYECQARVPAGAWGPASIPWADVVSSVFFCLDQNTTNLAVERIVMDWRKSKVHIH